MQGKNLNSYLIRHNLYEGKASRIIYDAISVFVKSYPDSDPVVLIEAYRKVYSDIISREASVIWVEEVEPVLGVMAKNAANIFVWRSAIQRFFEATVRPIAQAVANTTIKLLQKLELVPETPKNERRRILIEFLKTQEGRAINLGRTATTHSMNRAALLAIATSNLPWQKAWVSIKDEETRNAHLAMDSKNFIDLEEPFSVGGEPMMFPADSSSGASIGNIANCRCTMQFRIKRRR